MEQLVDTLDSLGASAVGIAVTATFSQQQFARDLQLRFPLLSDWQRDVSRSWGVSYDVWKGHDGVAKRALFVLGEDATVHYAWVTDDALVLPDYEAMVAVVRRLHEG